jgi:hypothetical protein
MPATASEATFRVQIHPRREVESLIYSDLGWVWASFAVPKPNTFVDYLNGLTTPHLKLLRVTLGEPGNTVPFVSMASSACLLIVPRHPEEPLLMTSHPGQTRSHDVSCLFPGGWASGSLATLAGQRVSDAVTASKPFLLLRNCSIYIRGRVPAHVPLAVINGSRVTAVTEPSLPKPSAAAQS